MHHIGAISRTRSERLGPLIDSGPFAHVRNPLYIGNVLLWIGFALSAKLPWLAPVVFLLLALEYRHRPLGGDAYSRRAWAHRMSTI